MCVRGSFKERKGSVQYFLFVSEPLTRVYSLNLRRRLDHTERSHKEQEQGKRWSDTKRKLGRKRERRGDTKSGDR